MTLNYRFYLLIQKAESLNLTIHDICFRRAGVGIMWCDQVKLEELGEKNYKQALFIVQYYPTLSKAVDGELSRLKMVQEAIPSGAKLLHR